MCCPVFGLGLAPCIVPLPFTLSVPFVLFPFFFCLVLLCLLWVGKCGGGTVPRFPLLFPTVRVCCHSIVGLGLCLCDRVVSLWNSGGGVCWVEGCVCGVLWCVWVCGCGVSLLVSLFFFFLFLFVLVFGVVRAQPCEHARYPRTPLRLPCCLLCLPFSALLCSAPRLSSLSAFLLLEWRWVFTMCRSVVLA